MSYKRKNTFPIVGLGASAGGLDALKRFFSEVPENSGMAYIVVIHMHPEQPSLMPELLQRVSELPVAFAKDEEIILQNRVYVVPPNKEIRIYKGAIQLLDLIRKDSVLPIDFFLRSLAEDQGARAVGVILSGTGTDGTRGIREIKSRDGLVLVQSLETAQYTGMPQSAIETGAVDTVLSPEKMPKMLGDYSDHDGFMDIEKEDSAGADETNWLNKLFAILSTQVGHDFSAYKKSTILRRIQRRMDLNQIDNHDQYISFLRENPKEVDTLFREFLIGVTHFFREPEVFDFLRTEILSKIIDRVDDGSDFRVWVPGCSTGEDVYSLAIVIQEFLDDHPKTINLQFFGTDIDDRAVDKARRGLYPAGISADISKDRINRFFVREGDYFRIRKDIRDKIVFSIQDVIKDPPFSRIDLLCCRNLLIYLKNEVQKKILSLFHYTLKPEGVLILGNSETIGQFTNLFQTLNKKLKIYARREIPAALRGPLEFPTGSVRGEKVFEKEIHVPSMKRMDIGVLTRDAIIELVSPTAVLVDSNGFILHVQGRTGKYLETVSGPPTQNILDMAREGLRIELSSALRKARTNNKEVVRGNLIVKTNGDEQYINLYIYPLQKPRELEGRYLVVFEDVEAKKAGEKFSGADPGTTESSRIRELEQELQSIRVSHQTMVEELESANEELKSANEEMHSSNEELQSTNEELESSREELQSLNEELQTVNSELQSKVEELSAAYDDMHNLLNSTEVASIFVDNEIRIKRFTQEAESISNLIQTDIGRPLRHIVMNLEYNNLIQDVEDVLEKLEPKGKEVRSKDNVWYHLRVVPYRTMDNRIDGAVLTFLNIDNQKKYQEELEKIQIEKEQTRLLISRIFDMNPKPLAVLDKNGCLVIVNTAFTDLMKIGPGDIAGTDVFKLKNKILSQTELKNKLQESLNKDQDFETGVFSIGSGGGKKSVFIRGQVIHHNSTEPYRILLVFEDGLFPRNGEVRK